jgi:hypothetical protein
MSGNLVRNLRPNNSSAGLTPVPLWPSGNGEIERQNRSLLKRMKIANAERKTWETELQTYLKMYRSTPHSTTGVSPAELLFGQMCHSKIEVHCL